MSKKLPDEKLAQLQSQEKMRVKKKRSVRMKKILALAKIRREEYEEKVKKIPSSIEFQLTYNKHIL